MNEERKKVYESIASKIGNTRLQRISADLPNSNYLWLKRECDNPFGSHYDRVYLALFGEWEENKGLEPGMNVLETSSGSAGVSFAGIGRLLGYNCHVMIPKDPIKQKRIKAIEEQGGNVILTPSEEDIQGFTKQRIIENIKKYNARFLNHSRGPGGTNNETTLKSLESIAREALGAPRQEISVYIAGIGNGSSILGPGRVFKENNPDFQIFGYMPKRTGKSHYPGLMNQSGLEHPVDFPHLREAQKILSGIETVEDFVPSIEMSEFGRSTLAGIKVALRLTQQLKCKDILVLGYDKSERYNFYD